MTRRRLCFVGWGDHVHLERWAGWFAEKGHDVHVISFAGTGHYQAGVQQHVLGLKGRGPRWVRLKLRWLLWRIRPELVHVHWAHFAVPVRAVWRGPLIVTAWGSDIYRREQFDDTAWQQLGATLRASELVTCDSDDLAATMGRQFALDAGRVRVIQWGVDTRMFSVGGPDRRAALGLGSREVVFSARNFTPLYNQETVVRAFAKLRERRPGAFLLMKSYGGDPDCLARIRAEITSLKLGDDVHILDAMPYSEMPALYRSADVTVSVPLSDASPMALLEAMASGSPCVVCDLPSLREWVVDGQTGYLVPATDIDAVAQALERALQRGPERERVQRAARELVVTKASQDAHMAVAGSCYSALCGPAVAATHPA